MIVAFLTVAVLWGSLWAYVEYETHRARRMFEETSSISVGDSEASILPLVRRFSGFKWTPEPLGPRERWLDKDEYDYQKNRVTDYSYELGLTCFGTIRPEAGRVALMLGRLTAAIPARLRPALGMREWIAEVRLSIRLGRVQDVSARTVFAGSCGSLGHSWELAEGMPHYGMPRRNYVIGVAHLTTDAGGGTLIENFLEPQASPEEVEAARQFNTDCLTSVKGCSGLCDVAPSAIAYLKRHPDAAWNIIPPKCP